MQLYERLYYYIHEYQKLIYDIYSKSVVAFLVTYYNLDMTNTVWEDQKLMGGYYEKIGELSGVKWNRIYLLPVFYITEVSTAFDGSETGLLKQNESEFIIPSSYGMQPFHNDLIKFEQDYLKITNNTHPLFVVTGLEKSANADRTFWKMKVKIEQSRTTAELEPQVSGNYVFYDYSKLIYQLDDAISMTKTMQKNEILTSKIKTFFNSNSGLYYV
jgi:hypothetical protein